MSKNAVANLVIGSQEPGDNFDILRTKVVSPTQNFDFCIPMLGLRSLSSLR